MSMKRFTRALAAWAWGMVGGCLGGGLASLGSWLTANGLNAIGVNVPKMDFNTAKVVFLVGVLTHGVAYYMKSPLPPLQFDDTQSPFPNEDGSNVNPNSKTP
jgi:hypothetical protein